MLRFVRATAILTVLATLPTPSLAAEATAEKIVDTLNRIFGAHGVRSSHAKGQCVTGMFTPTAEAPTLTKSPHFAKPGKVLGRFSMGGGNPEIPDATKTAVRGFAFRLDHGSKSASDFAFISAPIQFAKTLDQFLGFLEARVPGADGKPDQEKIKAFAAANPETTAQGKFLAGNPVPGSYAGIPYWGVHAFTLTDAAGAERIAKLKLVPASTSALTDDEAKAKPTDFLVAELTERIAKGPATLDLVAILGESGDPTDDPAALWPEDARKQVKLGTLAVTKIEDNEFCDLGMFDPTLLADGIAGPKNDELFAVRSEAYAISFSRRPPK